MEDKKPSPEKEEKKELASASVYLKIIAKNFLSLPGMARDMNVARQNVQKLVTLMGGEKATGADAHWLKTSQRTEKLEVEEGKEKPTPVVQKEEAGKELKKPSLVDKAKDKIKENAVGKLKGLGKKVMGGVKKGLSSIMNIAKKLFNPKMFMSILGRMALPILILTTIWQGITGAWEAYKETGSIWEAIKGGAGQIIEFFTFGMIDKKMVGEFMDNVLNYLQPVTDAVSSFFSSIGDWFSEKFESIREFFVGKDSKIEKPKQQAAPAMPGADKAVKAMEEQRKAAEAESLRRKEEAAKAMEEQRKAAEAESLRRKEEAAKLKEQEAAAARQKAEADASITRAASEQEARKKEEEARIAREKVEAAKGKPTPAPAPVPAPAPAKVPAPAPVPVTAPAPAKVPAPAPVPVTAAPTAAPAPAAKPEAKPPETKAQKISSTQGKEAMISEMDKNKITDPTARAAIMAQVGHESGNFTTLSENLNYKSSTLLKLFPKKFSSPDDAQKVSSGGAQSVAERIYGGRMGNAPEGSGEGFLYRGRGFIQLTGKQNYTRFGYSSNPEDVSKPQTAAESAIKFMKGYKGDWSDVKAVTKFVNGGYIGLEDRMKHFEEYLKDPKITKSDAIVASAAPTVGESVAKSSVEVSSGQRQQQKPTTPIIVNNTTVNNNTTTKNQVRHFEEERNTGNDVAMRAT